MIKDTTDYVKRCAECQVVRKQVPKKVAPVQAQEATGPLQYVQADLYYVGKSHNKNDYVMVMEDRATKHCRLFAVRDRKKQKALPIALNSTFLRWAVPTDGEPTEGKSSSTS